MNAPIADHSVRVAWASDASAIAALQVEVWQARLGGSVPADLLPTDPAQLEPAWHAALTAPGDARRRVLVALERNRVVGFVLTCPSQDPDCDPGSVGELSELTLAVDERGQGHGSRLVQAAVDTLIADRFTRAVTWIDSTDDPLRAFFASSGWEADGAHRELAPDDTSSMRVKQVRLHTTIAGSTSVEP